MSEFIFAADRLYQRIRAGMRIHVKESIQVGRVSMITLLFGLPFTLMQRK